MSGGGREPVKVIIINTQYVETDKMSFKSVVQSLTGKDSVVAPPIAESSFPRRKVARPMGIRPGVEKSQGVSVLSRDVSFKELDRFLMELPPMDEPIIDKVATSTSTNREYSIDYRVMFAQITKIIGICTLNVITVSSTTASRRRGANKLKRVQEATQPLVVESNTYGQPCNDEECPLARFIGLLIRDPNFVSINVKD
ncbi:hypothetical protein HHK36_004939 [Tetracentron sinense]|uniref:VQ domain-containing protein n=1 Tax=Tetracentron sinense TaxID=13715 RepID=A0A834ZNG3_TETSI|nr:hypothetical protein HHK36_004939 [Tetracentron sinense]